MNQRRAVGGKNPVKLLLGDGAQRQHVAAPGVGEQNIESSLFFSNLRVNLIQIGHSGDVRADSYRRGANVCPRSIQFGLTTSGDIDLRSLRRQLLCRCETNTGAAAGHQSDFSCKRCIHTHNLLL